jgi:quinoprotein glucose dehydrogenase
MHLRVLLLLPFLGLVVPFLNADGTNDADPYVGRVAKKSDEWKKTLQRMQLPAGVQADLWAAEPHVANIVSFAFDEKGRCYVAETFRLHAGVTDNRGHRDWLDDELAARTVDDRIALYKKYLKQRFADYEKDQDRVRLVEDSTGSGRADRATVFAGGFSRAADGIGSGVLARGGKVWYTCIPDLWLLQDTKGGGHADVKKSLHTGYGVHVSFIGHDMHGLRMGPDGKLYFSIGDRGLHVKTDGKTIDVPDTGSVLRCNPDGSELEVVATGLRNPQELAFDEFGNLFTCDNNADGGDAARCVYIVEGGDSGWRIGYQYMASLGPWNSEKVWHTQATNTAAYVVPPLAHIANGPSGFTYHPGTSLLPPKFERHFFLCDFRGSGGGSGVHSFALKPKGASFEVIDREKLAWGVLATDCDFGPDGGFYISDWVEGWGLPNKGRIWKLADPGRAKDGDVAEVKHLLDEGFAQRPTASLAALLGHKDQRVRQEAQFTLAEHQDVVALESALQTDNRMARLHGIWGLGQVGRKKSGAFVPLAHCLNDRDAEVRAQVLKVLGDARVTRLAENERTTWDMAHEYSRAMKDPEPRVRFFAALAAGKLGSTATVPAVLALLEENADADPYLRHAGVMALAGIGDKATQQAADDSSASVRLAALLAMRRRESAEVARFLRDPEPRLVLEAARAIYDVPISTALPKLTELTRPGGGVKALPAEMRDGVLMRALAAHHRLGTKADAHALAECAARGDLSEKVRTEALKLLGTWDDPPGRDRVVGLWRPIGKRPATDVPEAIRPALAGIMTGPDKVRAEGARLAAKHGIKEVGPVLCDLVADTGRPSGVRVASLRALESLKDAQLDRVAEVALKDTDARLRHEARRVLVSKQDASTAVQGLGKILQDAVTPVERQGALNLLAHVNSPGADDLLGRWLDHLRDGKAPPELELDILEAARQRAALKSRVAEYEKGRPRDKSVSAFREALAGGDADAGQAIFFDKPEVSCLRCHKVNGTGGDVGPELTGIGAKQKREYLLEAIVDPNKQIAKGYESVVLVLTDGQTKTGILKSEDASEVRLMNTDGQLIVVAKGRIDERLRGPSAMPADLVDKLSRAELRDLVEFLASLKK